MEAIKVVKFEDVRKNFDYIEKIVHGLMERMGHDVDDLEDIDHFFLGNEEIPLGRSVLKFDVNGEIKNLIIEIKNVWYTNFGDGNEMYKTLLFVIPVIDNSYGNVNVKYEKFYITAEGYYSSWDCSEYNKYYFSKPYEYTETRYDLKVE